MDYEMKIMDARISGREDGEKRGKEIGKDFERRAGVKNMKILIYHPCKNKTGNYHYAYDNTKNLPKPLFTMATMAMLVWSLICIIHISTILTILHYIYFILFENSLTL